MHDSEFFVSRYLNNCLDSNERNQSAALIKLNILLMQIFLLQSACFLMLMLVKCFYNYQLMTVCVG